jgi:FAD:protein FMN transferase
MRKVQQIMGMPISIDIPDCDAAAVFDAAFALLRRIDDKFSTYKSSSEVSRFAAGKIAEEDLSYELKQVIKACRQAEAETGGYFSAWAAGAFDPSGYVKGWAIAEAGKVIENSGYKTYCAGAGGDILARSDAGFEWKIGIQDPNDRTKILDVLSISNGAVCTSGSYERGAHIINPKTRKPAKELLSVTITGPDVIQADVLATACFAMGKNKAMEFMRSRPGYEIIAV